jgi:hypothetical protein
MNMDRLRILKDETEILTLLNSLCDSGAPIMVWQKIQDQERVVFNGEVDVVSQEKKVFMVSLKEPIEDGDFTTERTIYLRGEMQSILFKQKTRQIKNDRLAITIPDEIRVIEKRAEPRLDLSAKRVFSTLSKLDNAGISSSKLQARLLDVSELGLSVMLNKKRATEFYEGDIFCLLSLNKTEMENEVVAKVMYIREIDPFHIRVGFRFDERIDKKLLKNIFKSSAI